ncbi:MAG: TraU family protein [Micavibrio sp.]|nr:TraU family protein [Micavibrio sp.]
MTRLLLIPFWLLLTLPLTAQSQGVEEIEPTEISTSDILNAPITDRSCHNYCLTGVCIWLNCGLHGCSIETSIRVRHYQPDLVVGVYEAAGTNPWNEAREVFGTLEESTTALLVGTFHNAIAGYGERTEGKYNADRSLRYKEATAVGHPLALSKL